MFLAALGVLALILGFSWEIHACVTTPEWVINPEVPRYKTGAWVYSTPAPRPRGVKILYTLALAFTLPLIGRLILTAVLS